MESPCETEDFTGSDAHEQGENTTTSDAKGNEQDEGIQEKNAEKSAKSHHENENAEQNGRTSDLSDGGDSEDDISDKSGGSDFVSSDDDDDNDDVSGEDDDEEEEIDDDAQCGNRSPPKQITTPMSNRTRHTLSRKSDISRVGTHPGTNVVVKSTLDSSKVPMRLQTGIGSRGASQYISRSSSVRDTLPRIGTSRSRRSAFGSQHDLASISARLKRSGDSRREFGLTREFTFTGYDIMADGNDIYTVGMQ